MPVSKEQIKSLETALIGGDKQMIHEALKDVRDASTGAIDCEAVVCLIDNKSVDIFSAFILLGNINILAENDLNQQINPGYIQAIQKHLIYGLHFYSKKKITNPTSFLPQPDEMLSNVLAFIKKIGKFEENFEKFFSIGMRRVAEEVSEPLGIFYFNEENQQKLYTHLINGKSLKENIFIWIFGGR